jgi:hypothetical protein
MYEAKEERFRSEGDTPAFLHVINTGLQSAEHPSYGGWGGRFALAHNVWKSVDQEGSSPHSILRWAKDFQNDWAARADWCVADFEEANHPPHVVLGHGDRLSTRSGEQVVLDARSSTDPDGDELRFTWWHYVEASTYNKPIDIEGSHKAVAALTIPDDATGDSIHMICSVTDAGKPPLTRYARVIIETRDASS